MNTNPHNRDRIRARLHDKIIKECAGHGIYRLSPAASAVLNSGLNEMMQKPSLSEIQMKQLSSKTRKAHYTETQTGPHSHAGTASMPSRPATSCSIRPGSAAGIAALRNRPSTPSPFLTREQVDYTKIPPKMRATGAPLGPIYKKKLYERLADAEWEDKLDQNLQHLQRSKHDEGMQKTMNQHTVKQGLDDQLTLLERQRTKDRAKEEAFLLAERERKTQWDQEQKQEAVQKWENRNRERDNLKEQIATREEEKRQAELQRKAEEEAYAQTIANEHQTRKMEEQRKREKEYAEIQVFLDYNAEMSDKKKKDKANELEMEKKYLADYEAYLERKEQDYKDNLARIAHSQTKRVTHATKTYYKSLWDMEQKDAEKAEKEQQELQERLLADEAARKQRILLERKVMKDTLSMQVSEKQRLKKEEREEQRRLRRQLEQLIEEEQEELAKGKSKRALEQLERAKELDYQVQMLERKQRSPMEIKIGSREDPVRFASSWNCTNVSPLV